MLGEILIADGVLDQDGLQEALDWQVLYGGRLGTNLLELQLIDEAALGRALRKRLGIEVVTGELTIDETMVGVIPKIIVDREEIMPWKIEKRRLKILCVEPKVEIFDELAMKLQRACVPVVAPEFRVINALRAFFGAKRQMRALDFGVVPPEQLEARRKKKKLAAGEEPVQEAPALIDEGAFNDIYNQILERRTAGAHESGPAQAEAAQFAPATPAAWQQPAPAPMPGVWPAGTALPPGYIFASAVSLPPGFALPPGYVAIVPFVMAPVAPAPVATPPPQRAPTPPAAVAPPPPAARPPPPPPPATRPPTVPPAAPAPARPPPYPGARLPVPPPAPPAARAAPPQPAPLPSPPAIAKPSPWRTAPPTVAPPAPQHLPAPPPQPAPIAPPAAHTPTVIRSRSAVRRTMLTEGGKPIPQPEVLESLPDDAILEELPADAIEQVAEVADAEVEEDLPLVPVTSWGAEELAPVAVVDESPLEFKQALEQLKGVTDRNAVAHLVLRAARSFAARALLMTVQGGVALGWDGIGEGLSGGAARTVAVPLVGEGAFPLVVKTRSHFLGPLQKTTSNIRFLGQCGKKIPLSSLLVPILHRGRVSHLLYLDNGHKQQAPTDVGEMLILSQRIAQTVEALVERKRRSR